ncbi:hypothetical protein [Streptomyces erythrochromogenes]|uniref:hypothetical protein n=1 Tax=Streptomyces erythrochromogenes TaxID=285574 RepID=UPI00381513AB
MATTHLRACDVPEVRQGLLQWADDNVVRGQRGSGVVQADGFTDPFLLQSAVRGAEPFFVNDRMMWPARATGEELPMGTFDADDLPDPIGFLLWSDDPSEHTQTLGRPRAVLWCRAGMTVRVLVLDDAGPYWRALEELGHRADPAWARQVRGSPAGDLAIGFGARIPLNTETEWDEVKHTWAVARHGRLAKASTAASDHADPAGHPASDPPARRRPSRTVAGRTGTARRRCPQAAAPGGCRTPRTFPTRSRSPHRTRSGSTPAALPAATSTATATAPIPTMTCSSYLASGTVSVFPDVNSGRLQNEQVIESSSTWTHARVIALGEYGMNDWEDDLFVRWSDGEVTMYGNTQAGSVGREYQLVPPPAAAFAARSQGGVRPDDPCAKVCGPELYLRSQ